ncbi:Bifunctional uridylyltransferase/uridylyl-removing enzyme [Polystyrenella longa]|uniref:Bifunctional uridylyltransferase/uridylyl-removing enzyme n=1 Tax=Polystyrenella longa TaxID=2528007 RepID=A0A518CQ56_9PLAN|nr:[protein-PII] uridylyltransferase [Polystyrenella longa]QDU81353.1 Bifunctional uridylyltransferase/uridylyl-removing enzyme [Polystyrenella longa]
MTTTGLTDLNTDWVQSLAEQIANLRVQESRLYQETKTGSQTALAISETTDSVLIKLWEHCFQSLSESDQNSARDGIQIIAIGGSGRSELAPFSDTDLLFLYKPSNYLQARKLIDRFVPLTWDVGLKPGSNFTTTSRMIEICKENLETASAVVESRLLWGSESGFYRFENLFYKKVIRNRKKAFIDACIAARANEQEQLGSTTKHLQPNVKKSKGGLRDLHLLRWIAYAHYKTTRFETLKLMSVLSRDDVRTLQAAQDFLLRIRINMHLHAGRGNDILDADEQIRLSQEFGYKDDETMRDVEYFMRDYFQKTSAQAELVDRFVSAHHLESRVVRFGRLLTTLRIENDFVMSPDYINVPPRSQHLLQGRLKNILRLYRSTAYYSKLPSPQTTQLLLDEAQNITEPPTSEEADIFMEHLALPGFLNQSIRHMFRTEVLDRVIPQFGHVRFLLQFNNYHSYTVDEHTFRALEAAEKVLGENSTAGTAYEAVRDKALLHLAILLHDIGKGYPEDHSEVGRRVSEEIANQLHLSQTRRETLVFLVHKHLMLGHAAFRRDTSDVKLLYELAHEIGTTEKLRMLYLLTIADLKAVGPGVWTDWKEQLLTELFDSLMKILAGKSPKHGEKQRREMLKTRVLEHFLAYSAVDTRLRHKARWVLEQVERFPSHYWANTPVTQIARDLILIEKMDEEEIHVYGKYVVQNNITEYRIITHEKQSNGLFHRAVGVLTAKHFTILSAHINTTFDGHVLDTLLVQDPDCDGPVPEERMEEVSEAIKRGIRNQESLKPYFQRHMRFKTEKPLAQSNEPLRIQIDTQSSRLYTIISVFSHDHRGLLYTITRCMDDLQLSVNVAKIATSLDQVADVFYVVDASGEKITDQDRIQEIHDYMYDEIRYFNEEGFQNYRT